MADVLEAVFTDTGVELLIKGFGSAAYGALAGVDSFKAGEGGYIIAAGGAISRDPSAHVTETDIDIIVDAGRPAGSKRYSTPSTTPYFQKSLVSGDFDYSSTPYPTLYVSCILDFGEYNDDGDGNYPEIWEIGLFSGSDMVAYATFDKQIKSPDVRVVNVVRLQLARG
jgi:hypothetical protein